MKSAMPLRTFLSLHFGVLAVLPVIVIAFLIWLVVMPAIQNRTGIRHQAMASSIAGQVSAYLEGGERQLTALAEYLQEGGIEPGRVPVGLLDAQCGDGELFEALFIVDTETMAVQSVGLAEERRWKRSDFMGLDLSGRQFIPAPKTLTKAVWSQTFLSTVTSRMAVALIVPLTDAVIIGEITLDNLSEFISHLPLESQWLTLVIDDRGMIVADSQKLRGGQTLAFDFRPARGAVDGESFSSNAFELDGKRMVGTLVAMDGPGWNVLVAQSVRNAFKPIRDTFLLLALGVVIALVLALSASWFQAGKLSQLFHIYAERAQSIAEGQYTLQWPPARTKEFHQLGKGLQRMAEKISRREKALVENEERIKNLVVNVPGVVYQYKVDPNALSSSKFTSVVGERIVEIFGLDSELESFFDDFIARLPEGDRTRFPMSVKNALEAVSPWYYEGPFTKPSGETIWFEGRSVPRWVDGELVYYGVLMDITQRKEMEFSLRLSQFILDKANIGIYMLGENGEFQNVNEAAGRSLGYSQEELCTMDVFDVDTIFTPERWAEHMADLRNHGVNVVETVHRHKNGKVFPVEVIDNIMTFEGREFHVAFVQDITERKRMEQALKESEQRLDLALSGANEGIWDWHIPEDTLYLDPRYYTMAGYRPGEFPSIFDEILKRVHPDDVQRVRSINDRYLAGDLEIFNVEFRFQRKDGSYMWIQAKGKIVAWDDQGTPLRFTGTNTDITERKQAERELEHYRNNLEELVKERTAALSTAKEQAEAANRAKSEFLSNMSHELRTPLNAIMGFSQLMGRDATLSDNQKENLNLIHRSGKHLLALINDVLDMSKIEAGQAELRLQDFDLHSCIHGLAEWVQSRAGTRGLVFKLDIDHAVPLHVNGDEGKLRQILINLLGNALKFTRTGDVSLQVEADPTTATNGDPTTVHFIVSDTGEGVPEELQEAIFKPFVQVKRGTTDNPGTGLGLSISRRFARLMGGEITVSSRPEQGAEFALSVPFHAAATIPAASRPRQRVIGIAGDTPGFRILVVEDNADNRLLVTGLLETVGFEVRHAVNGREGVDLFSEWRPDLVFMDVRMPVLDGLSATRQIKSLDAGRDTPVIALTAHAFEEERSAIVAAGCDDFLSKPVDENLLFDAIGRHLKINFTYQQDKELTAERQTYIKDVAEGADPMVRIPKDLSMNLREAALDLDTVRFNDYIEQVKRIDTAAYRMLKELVDDYRFDEILELLT